MNRFFLQLAVVLLFTVSTKAQSTNPALWCPTGATWTYGYFDMTSVGTVTAWYSGDTLVTGQRAQIVKQRVTTTSRFGPGYTYSFSISPVVTRVVADRLEVLANGQFYTLYDFAAQPGQNWPTVPVTPRGPCTQTVVQVRVDSVGLQQVGGRSLRWFRMHLTGASGTQPGSWSGRVYEQIGCVGYMQPQSPICHGSDPGFMGPLQSYQAGGSQPFTVVLQGNNLVLDTRLRAEAAGFRAFPNPASGASKLSIQLPAQVGQIAELRLLDVLGREMRKQPALAGQQFDVSGLPVGTYTLLLCEPGQAPLARRVVLQ